MVKSKKTAGRLLTNGVIMETHEYATINAILADGEDVELLERSRTPHSKSPDIAMLGMPWEMKSPTGRAIRPIEHAMRRATHQAPNIIIDLRRTKITDTILLIKLRKLFTEMRSVRNLWIVTKESEIIKLKKS